MQTYKERLIAGLQAKGWTLDKNDRSKYTAFTKPFHTQKLFVGTAGALRAGECASRSHSVGDPSHQPRFYAEVLELGTVVDPLADLKALLTS